MNYKVLYLHEAKVFGGAEESLLLLIKNLDRDRITPLVACPAWSEFSTRLSESGVKVCHMEYPGLRNIPATFSAIRKIKKIARQESVALIHANLPRANFMGAVAAKLCKIPIVWHERTMLEEGMVDIDRIFAKLADKIICNSEAIRKRWIKNSADKTLVILNGVDLDKFNPSIWDIRREINFTTPVVGIISRLSYEKGLRYFIEAASKVLKEIEDVAFVIVGDFKSPAFAVEHKKDMDRLVTSLKLEDRVFFLGFRADIPRVMAGMDIVVLSSEVEGCARVLMEAMAMAKPVVATNSGGTPEIVNDGQTGILVPIKDSTAIADALIKLLTDKELLIKMGRQGRARAEASFSIKRNVAQTVDVYERLLNTR